MLSLSTCEIYPVILARRIIPRSGPSNLEEPTVPFCTHVKAASKDGVCDSEATFELRLSTSNAIALNRIGN
jgi:hypothetical protein